jgi:Divergent InlB B-repeat domain
MHMWRFALVAVAVGCAGPPAPGGDTGASATSPDSGFNKRPPLQHTLSVGIDGQGTVTSTPAGISCPGTCSAAFDEGTTIALNETPAPGQRFVLWTSACTGGRDCTFALGSDTEVGAHFRIIPPNRCAGLATPALPSSTTATAMAWDMNPASCGAVFGDGSGNLYTDTYYVLSNETKQLLPHAFLFVTLNAGFTAYSQQMAPVGSLTAYTPNGVELSSTPMHGYMSTGGVQFNGGIVGVDADCYVTKTILVDRIDADGKRTSHVELAGEGCLTTSNGNYLYLYAVVDAEDRLLIATNGASIGTGAIAAGRVGARWFDAAGQPLTAWFDVGTGQPEFFPLIGGGVALNSGGSWIATIASGDSMVTAPPLGFGSRMQTVFGGTAYARISAGKIDIVDPSSGATCSTLSVPAGTVNVGGDGSLLYWDPEGRDRTTGLCTITVYPRVLR